jgi:hypothetical protein
MKTIVYLCHESPSKFSDEMSRAGYDVYDSLSGSEVLHLIGSAAVAAVVIAHGIEDRDVEEIRSKCVTLQLGSTSTAQEVVFELCHLFSQFKTVQ